MFTKRQIGKGIPTMGRVQIFTGDGYGKTMAALGEALIAAASGKRVVVIQFLKGRGLTDSTFERQLESSGLRNRMLTFYLFRKINRGKKHRIFEMVSALRERC